MDEQPSPPNELERLDAALAAVERERGRRREAKWLAGEWTIPVRIADPGTVGLDHVSRVLSRQSLEFPPEFIEIHIIDPKPVVEPREEQFDQPDARDVTPPPHRPPSPPQSSAHSLPPPVGQADPQNYNIPRDIAAAERRRTQRFMDDDWGSPQDHPIRYSHPRAYDGHRSPDVIRQDREKGDDR